MSVINIEEYRSRKKLKKKTIQNDDWVGLYIDEIKAKFENRLEEMKRKETKKNGKKEM